MSWSLLGPVEQLSSTVTYIFVHDGIWHALSNIWFLGLFGGPIERQLGRRKYVLSLLIFIICCALTDLALRPNSVVPLVGASGLVAGLMGFFLVAYPRSRLLTVLPIAVPFPVKVPIAWFMAIWLSLQIAVLLMGPSFDVQSAWWIHLAGFILGCVFGLISATPVEIEGERTQS
ncbi:MAG: rhomboid family intramembrane serine protease [Myxococcota bacterium]|nr:rhomboid family intramembrane serine protease [Myxococcota bacterium]